MAIEAHWAWLLAGLLLAIAEIIAPGFFLIWIGAAAIVAGLATLALGLSFALQFAVFAVATIVALYAGRRWLRLHPFETSDPMLNDRAARLVGRTVIATEPIGEGGGRVRVGDGIWNASGPEAPVGARLLVVGIEGGTLKVTPMAPGANGGNEDNETGDGL